jgi:hypothetical protein
MQENPFAAAILELIFRFIEQMTPPHGPLEVAPGDRLPVQNVPSGQDVSPPSTPAGQPAARALG